MNKFRVLTGLHSGADVPLEDRPYLIGSDDSACDIILTDPAMAKRQCALMCISSRRAQLEVFADDAVRLNDAKLAAGSHVIELPVHLRLGEVEVLLTAPPPTPIALPSPVGTPAIATAPIAAGTAAEVAPNALASGPTVSQRRAPRARRWRAYGIGGTFATLAMYLTFSQVAIGSSPPALGNVDKARQVLDALDHRELAVQAIADGRLVITGYVRGPEDAQRIRSGLLRVLPSQQLALQLVQGGATAEFGGTGAGADAPKMLGAGTSLLDGNGEALAAAAAAATAKAAPAITLRLRAWQAGESGYVEAASGTRYAIGSVMPGGFTLVAVDGDSITVTRDKQELRFPLRQTGG